MNRQEYKFLINRTYFEKIKSKLILIKKYNKRIVNSYYYDTVNLDDFIDSEEGTVPRKKIRFRWYGNKKVKQGNFEIKETFDLKRKKTKLKINNFDTDISNILDKYKKNYQPILKISYDREYYYSNLLRLDITYDTNISYERINKNYMKMSKFKETSNILEIKTAVSYDPNFFLSILGNKIVKNSKYCVAINKLSIY